MRRQQGQFRPLYQLCTVPQSTSELTNTPAHSPTQQLPSVARIPRVCAPRCALSCGSVRAEEKGSGGKMHSLTKGSYYSFVKQRDNDKAVEPRSGFLGRDERIINLSPSETPLE